MELHELPTEIFYHILSYIPAQRDLSSLSTVNGQYCGIVRKELYKRDAASTYPQALHWASYKDITKTAELALDAGTDIDRPMPMKTAKWCDQSKIMPIGYGNKYTPLTLAVNQGHLAMVKFLVDKNATVWYEKRSTGRTVPLPVCDFTHPELLGFLLDLTPEYMECTESWWEFVFRRAMKTATQESLDVLFAKLGPSPRQMMLDTRDNLLHHSIIQGNVEAVKWLGSHGANISGTGETHTAPPVVTAMSRGQEEIVEWLLDQGVDFRYGMVPEGIIFLAIEHGVQNKSVIDIFLQKGGNIHARDLRGATTLHIASCKLFNHFIPYLLERGVDVNSVDNQGVTPLMIAAAVNNAEGVRALIKAGARLDAVDDNGRTPLHWACWQDPLHLTLGDGFWVPVELLLRPSPDTAYADNHGMTPLHVAVLHRQGNDIIKKLEEQGFDMDTPDRSGLTPRDITEMMTPPLNYWNEDPESGQRVVNEEVFMSYSEPEALKVLKESMNGSEWGYYNNPLYEKGI